MNNKDNYKNAIEQIQAREELKEKTIQKIRDNRNKKKITYLKYLSACAVFVIAITSGKFYYDRINNGMLEIEEKPLYIGDTNKVPLIALNKNLPRFSSIKELEDVIKENTYFITIKLCEYIWLHKNVSVFIKHRTFPGGSKEFTRLTIS